MGDVIKFPPFKCPPEVEKSLREGSAITLTQSELNAWLFKNECHHRILEQKLIDAVNAWGSAVNVLENAMNMVNKLLDQKMESWLSMQEVLDTYFISKKSVYKRIRDKTFDSRKIGGKLQILNNDKLKAYPRKRR